MPFRYLNHLPGSLWLVCGFWKAEIKSMKLPSRWASAIINISSGFHALDRRIPTQYKKSRPLMIKMKAITS